MASSTGEEDNEEDDDASSPNAECPSSQDVANNSALGLEDHIEFQGWYFLYIRPHHIIHSVRAWLVLLCYTILQ